MKSPRRWTALSGSTRRHIEKLVVLIRRREYAARHSRPLGMRYAKWQSVEEVSA
ncbi:MAG: hypothetical protein JNJ82_15370 [Opitutaceae bacterium]|nr:hypothetical protein [Opitutaceae bacterium]